MKNISKSSLSSTDGIKAAVKGLQNPQKEFAKIEATSIETAINSYDALCSPNCQLEQLVPIWSDTDTCTILGSRYSKYELAKSIYKSKRRFVLNRWLEIEAQNGGRQILCPICEVAEANEMDHYVPREKMPEFSAHIHNLIPLCHDCNHSKHDKWLINGSRACFNAYFDKVTSRLFVCSVKIDLGFPMIKISMDTDLSDSILVNTINELNLLPRYQNQLDRRLKEVIEYTKNHYVTQNNPAEEYMQSTYDGYKYDVLSDYTSYIDKILFSSLIESEDYHVWIIDQLNGLEHKARHENQ